MKTIRVAHLVSHPIPYFAPLYRELAGRDEVDLTVYFYSDITARAFRDAGFGRTIAWDAPLLDGYRSKFLPSTAGADISARFIKPPHVDVVREVARGRYDVVWAHGYAHLTTWLAAAAARVSGAQLLIRDEQTLLHGRPSHKRALKEVALRALYRQAAGLYIGEQSRRYFRHYGMPDERLFPARYCVDNRYWQRKAAELHAHRDAIRASFGVTTDAPVVLFSGKLIEKKQPMLLIRAFARVRERQECSLLIAGDGPLRMEAEAVVASLGVPDVHFAGFLNHSQLPEAYAAADIFVLPSKLHETWGLVVNEAMNFGLPVVVTDKVGCAGDLVHADRNGYVVGHRSVTQLASAIERLVGDQALRTRFGEQSRRIVNEYSIEACADGIVDACLAVTGREPEQRPLAKAA